MIAPPLALTARYIFPVAGGPIRGGVITIAGERIVAVGENRSGAASVDLGNVAILPGLVNAHTHLEFSDLTAPLGTPGNPLPDWIRQVMAHRRSADPGVDDPRGGGLAECARGGATSVGEIATHGWPAGPGAAPSGALLSPADVTVFWEVIGLRPNQFDERLTAARTHLSRAWPDADCAWPGLSPHAPYSVHPLLLEEIVRLAVETRVPLAMHVAESREELELLAHGTGPLRQLLEELGVWSPEVFAGGRRPLDYLRALAGAPRGLAIHGNYLDDEEIDFLAARTASLSVVFCPRTHAFFSHDPYPLAQMLARGVNVALGTDSRASNPDLSLLSEMRFCAGSHADVPGANLLEMATLAGARALGVDRQTGSLAAGKLANLAVVALPGHDAADPHELIMGGALPVVATWHRGVRVATTGSS
ncbi:MAG TPA: amidohydrolase family protein [Pirellulales bacterium]|jgi:cytosine/adenosine deaminase-related metal-dependent hydrolase|nr:amidohydrolase family protein [Pirellulales bacterium]